MLTISKLLHIALLMLLGSTSVAIAANSEPAAAYTLKQAVDYALENNPNLQMTHERIQQAQAQVGIAKASFYPQVTSRLTYEYSDNPSRAFGMIIAQRRLNFSGTDFNHPGGVNNYRPEVMASYSLYNGGQDTALSKAAELGVTGVALQDSATRNQLIEAVTSAFYAILAAQEAHAIAERAINAVQSELKQSQFRFDAGTLLKSDLLSLRVKLSEAQDAEIQTANGIDLAKTALKTLLGLTVNDPLAIAEKSVWTVSPKSPSFTTLLEQALAQRPEVQAAALHVAIAEQHLKAAQGAHLPKADAYVSYGSDSKDLAYSTNRDNVTAGVTVEMPIFSGFATSERINKAQSQLTEAQMSVKNVQLSIENEVKTAHLHLNSALARLDVTANAVTAAEEALRLVNEQRNAGVETVTRYIEAEVARDQAHSRVIAARYDALRAEANLNQAVGYWK
ncbi:MAG: TolC family protein [Methylococcales bacterium]|nr:TolC family protein [Methylococcales bacterium]